MHRDSAPADRSEQVNSPDRREVEKQASGGSQALAESEEINEMVLTPPQDPVEQATERSHITLTSQSAQPRFVSFLKNGNRRIKVNACSFACNNGGNFVNSIVTCACNTWR